MLRFAFLAGIALSALGFPAGPQFRDLSGRMVDPFSSAAHVRVFLFARTDCPITNRYAPELQRIAARFSGMQTDFWLVYPDANENTQSVGRHREQYQFPDRALFDPKQQLAALAHVTVAPEAAVFDQAGKLTQYPDPEYSFATLRQTGTGCSRPAAKAAYA
jgi:AhpC/TSA family